MSNITIYTTQSCPHCKKLKKFLQKNGVDYIEKDVADNEQFLEEMIEKMGKALVPVIELKDEIFIGFDVDIKKEIKEVLNRTKEKPRMRVN